MKINPMFIILPLFLLFLTCGAEITEPESLRESGEPDFPLLKEAGILLNGKILAFTPIIGKINFEIIEQSKSKIVTSITGISRFVVTTDENANIKILVTGDIKKIVIEQEIKDDIRGAAYLQSLVGNFDQKQVYGNSASDWYYDDLKKTAK